MIPLEIWQIDMAAAPVGLMARCDAVLSEDETAKAGRYRQAADRQRFRLGRGVARLRAAQIVGTAAQDFVITHSNRGKPGFRDVDLPFNVSHSGDQVWLAMGGGHPVGIDVQIDQPSTNAEAISDFALSGEEQTHLAALPEPDRRQAFFDLWVLREAALKATGQGIFEAMQQVSALPLPGFTGWGRASGLGPGVWTRQLAAPEGYRAAVAVVANQAPEMPPVVSPQTTLHSLLG